MRNESVLVSLQGLNFAVFNIGKVVGRRIKIKLQVNYRSVMIIQNFQKIGQVCLKETLSVVFPKL
jgi:hypothetical protein